VKEVSRGLWSAKAFKTAMVERMPYTLLRDAIFTHPTIAEGLVFLLGKVEGRKG